MPSVKYRALFNGVVEELEVEDVDLVGRKFTWYQPNDRSISRIDRALVSDKWREYRGNLSLWALPRDVSDHCPLVWKVDASGWGPKPFHFINFWPENRKFKRVVEEAWRKYGASGWMGFVLKSKVKGLKVDIREWSRLEYVNVDMRLLKLKEEIEGLDGKSKEGLLTNLEGDEW